MVPGFVWVFARIRFVVGKMEDMAFYLSFMKTKPEGSPQDRNKTIAFHPKTKDRLWTQTEDWKEAARTEQRLNLLGLCLYSDWKLRVKGWIKSEVDWSRLYTNDLNLQ